MWICAGAQVAAGQDINSFYTSVDSFLDMYVDDGMVAYDKLHNNPSQIGTLDAMITAIDIDALNDADKQAFLVNAYNILVIKKVLEHYPIKSPLDKKDFFDSKVGNVGGKDLTLNELEKGVLFKQYPDARFHFVLVCAAIGCPELADKAYRGESLNEQLDLQTKLTLNNPKHVQLDEANEVLKVTSLFSWYKADFTKAGSMISYINNYRTTPVAESFSVEFLDYNWDLNAQ